MRFLFCLVAFLVFSTCITAQSEHYNFSRLDIDNGLSHNQVNAILRDQTGFLWFGTMSGLDRYDGYTCKVLRSRPGDTTSLADNYISALYELPDGKMWVVTRNLPCIYDSRTEKFNRNYSSYLSSLGLPTGSISSILKGSNERFWFLYDSLGLYLYSNQYKKARLYRPAAQTSNTQQDKITAAKEIAGGKLWVIYQSGLVEQVDIKSNQIIFRSHALQQINRGIYSYKFFIDNDGDL